MPATLRLTTRQRHAWYEEYRQTFLERDLRQLGEIENLPAFVRLLTLAALRTGALLNKSALAAEAGLAQPKLRRYLNLLEVAGQFFELPSFHANLGKRLVKTPKLHANDVGLAAFLGGIDSWAEAASRGWEGALLESWALGELRALDRLSARSSRASFWRTSTGREVDLVLERGRDVVAIEIKATAACRLPSATPVVLEGRMAEQPRASLFQSSPPPELGPMIKALGITEAEARSGRGCLGIVLGLVVGGGAWAATQFIPFGVRMDTTEGFAISTAIALVLAAVVFFLIRLGKAEELVTFICQHGLARMSACKGVIKPVAIVRYAEIANVKLQLVRHGKNGISLRKIWSFVGADGRTLISLQGEGTMDRWSADPAKATPNGSGWEFAETAIAQWQAARSGR